MRLPFFGLLAIAVVALGQQVDPVKVPLQWDMSVLRGVDQGLQKKAIFSIHSIGKDSIPSLIDSIDDDTPFDVLNIQDPVSSYIPPESLKTTFRGVLFAYTIELILGKTTLRGNKNDRTFLIDHEDAVYTHALLRRNGEVLKKQDLTELKELYRLWWEKNKSLPLDELRREWAQNKRPLTASPFRWS